MSVNRAAELGPQKFDWWLDWRGKTVAVIACGPSARKADVDLLRGKMPVLAIKEAAAQLAPWCDAVYCCEAHWWRYQRGLPKFSGLKLAWAQVPEYPDVRLIEIKVKAKHITNEPAHVDELLLDAPGVIGAGGHSGFQAFNLALQFGAARVLLVGFDCHANGNVHFYGRNNWAQARNPCESVFPRWAGSLNRAADICGALGIEVVNASATSAISAFRKAGVAQTIEAWGL